MSQGPQMVGYEVTCSIIVLFFEAVNILIVLSLTAIDPTRMDVDRVLAALQLTSLIKAGLWIVYFLPLIFSCVVVAVRYDRHVWFRDIDDSPSPFPPSVILGFLCPCLATSNSGSPSSVLHYDALRPHALGHICVANCDCTTKPPIGSSAPASPQEADCQPSTAGSSFISLDFESRPDEQLNCTPDEETALPIHRIASSSSLSRSLVRIPNDIQRRDSTSISFGAA
ncbi:hypothetical protein HGRIS_002183 [Hohenbuehelia grisea]|uniref:Uncharacterized protein n=1 Tax=Hohenbuehelia grisea TaxID=104357 RepID=A0ABR3JJQ4_9AGAR